MFDLLTRILLWLLIGTILWYVFIRFIPRVYLTWLGGLIVFAFVILAFLDPTNRTVSSVWGILSLPLKPLGLVIFLLLSALKDGTKKIAANQVVAALLILLLSSMPIVAYWLTAQTERSIVNATALVQQANTTLPRAIVVLADDVDLADPSLRSRVQLTNLNDTFSNALASRLYYAARLYTDQAAVGNSPLVIVAAGPQLQLNPSEEAQTIAVQTIQNQLIGAGVPGDRIIVETTADDFYDSVVEIDRILETQGFQFQTDSILLVTPALNISRAVSTFARLGVRANPQPTDQFVFQLQEGRLLARVSDLIPNVDALVLTTRVVDEYLTSVYYFLRGWLESPY